MTMRFENDRRMKEAPVAKRQATSVYESIGLPHVDSAPVGARVIEARGPFCVALVLAGRFIGLFRK